MWFLHIESFCAFQPLFFEDLMLKFAKDNCLRPVASLAGTDDPWSGVGYIRKAAQRLYRRQSLYWLFNMPCNCAWDCCVYWCWCCCAQTTHDPNLSKGKESRQDFEPNPNIDFLPSSRAALHPPAPPRPNQTLEEGAAVTQRAEFVSSAGSLHFEATAGWISRQKQVVRPDSEGSVGMVEGVLRMRSDFE